MSNEERWQEHLSQNGGLIGDECEFCGGTGEVEVDERVYPNEPHLAPIGRKKCICQQEFEE